MSKKNESCSLFPVISIILVTFLLQSCSDAPGKKTSIKPAKQVVDSCACSDKTLEEDMQLSGPRKNTVLSSEKLRVIEEKTSYLVRIDLIADQSIDHEGEDQQIYRIEKSKGDPHQKTFDTFYFALPVKYNKHRNDLTIFSRAKGLLIGFKEKDKVIRLYNVYSHKYLDKQFGGGEIIVEPVNNKNYKVL